MKIDNEDTISGLHSFKLVMAVVAVLIILLMLFTNLPNFIDRTIGIGKDWVIAIIAFLYVLFFVYFIIKGTAYFHYNDDGNKIIIRYFLVRTFNAPKISIEIVKNDFYKFEIEKKGLQKKLYLYIAKGKKISKYPPLSIVSLTSSQESNLIKSLEALSKVKES
ncbi:MAG: hypothetical protein H6537_04135 [Bacteroidales bacterium]|nr:hypothetical protein [Bacteroidales bacterium]HPD94256.1 hypothetical protein [Tenuifilaceae bacterium]